MSRVDFYIVPAADKGPLPTACRLCDKAVGTGKRVHVHVPDPGLAQEFDRMLWTFRQGSFVGHDRAESVEESPPLASVLLGDREPRQDHCDVLLNLADEVPPFFDRFERVLEIVYGSDAERSRSRRRFKHYRDRGCTLETHDLGAV